MLTHKVINKLKFLASYYLIPKNSKHEKIVTINGYKMKIDISNDVGRKIFFTGFYEEPETVFCLKNIDKDDILIDVGANVGYFSLLFAQQTVIGEGEVYSIDPIPSNIEKLVFNARVNGFNNINIIQNAMGEEKSQLDFYIKKDNAYSSFANNSNSEVEEKIIVEVSTLDIFLEKNNINNIKILKIDTEGAEGMVLNGAKKSLQNGLFKYIIIELSNEHLNHFNTNNTEIDTLLKSFGYTPYTATLNGDLIKNMNTDNVSGNLIYAKA